MAEPGTLRELVFRMVAGGELTPEAAMALLRRAPDMTPAQSCRGGAAVARHRRGRHGRPLRQRTRSRRLLADDRGGRACSVEMRSGAGRRGGQTAARRLPPDEDCLTPILPHLADRGGDDGPATAAVLRDRYHAFEDAGYAPDALSGLRCGVFVGAARATMPSASATPGSSPIRSA